jgi:ABC-type Fe3+/spermidine/putrescine transport system ATPase subunit
MRKVPKSEIQARVRQALDIVRLSSFEDRYPAQLSGGQKQRVAIARSLAVRPAILLFDEPLSALDLSLRLKLRAEIKRLHEEIGFTAVYVTHDQSEAMAMSNQVAVMNSGRIEQIDTPSRIFHEPANEFVFNFIGESCCLNVKRVGAVMTDGGGQEIDLRMRSPLRDGSHRIYVRPSRIFMGEQAAACDNVLTAELRFVEFLGDTHRYHLAAGDIEIFCDQGLSRLHQAGEKMAVGWNDPDMKIYS